MRRTNFSLRKKLVKHFYANAFTRACYKAFEYTHIRYIVHIYILTSHVYEIDLSATRETRVTYGAKKDHKFVLAFDICTRRSAAPVTYIYVYYYYIVYILYPCAIMYVCRRLNEGANKVLV